AMQGYLYTITAFDDTAKTLTLNDVVGLAVGDLITVKANDTKAVEDIPIAAIVGNVITLTTTATIDASWKYAIKQDTGALSPIHAEGGNTIASGVYSHAEGQETVASGWASHAEGTYTTASGQFSHVEGEETIASGYTSHAEGVFTSASGSASHAEGANTKSNGSFSHAEGGVTLAKTNYTHVEGQYSLAMQGRLYTITSFDDPTKTLTLNNITGLSVSDLITVKISSSPTLDNVQITAIVGNTITINTTATIDSSWKYVVKEDTGTQHSIHAEGSNTVASGAYSHSQGDGTVASGTASHAEGGNTTANERYSHAEGYSTTASGYYSHTEGYGTTTGGHAAHAEGTNTTASGYYSHAEGNGTTASAYYSHAEGYSTIASGNACHAEGNSTTASGYYSHAEGQNAQAVGSTSHCEGSSTNATGENSHAEGSNTRAIGNSSHAEGNNSWTGDRTTPDPSASQYAHAEGNGTTASGYASHAEGVLTFASQTGSHAEGYNTTASGLTSHAEGYFTDASGSYSHAEGYATNAFYDGSHIMGQYGAASEAYSWFIANGNSSSPGLGAKWLASTGSMYVDGSFIPGGADYAEMFETVDGNSIEPGYFVTLIDEKICRAGSPDDYILGITSSNPSVVGDGGEMRWKAKYLTDEWGRILKHEVIIPAVVDQDGNTIIPEKSEVQPILNPDYDKTRQYIPRRLRPEWVAVGLIGKILVRDDGSCEASGYCQPDASGTATRAEQGYRVLKRTGPNQILILFK
ncbi:MAG: peptidase G2 autoproteolytic cleavage domain-containing protein, partial [Syntrophomonadaceae bacterium]